MRHIHQITLRGLSPELSRKIKDLARREGISLNKAALRLISGSGEKGDAGAKTIGDSLDHLMGSWSKERAEKFLLSIASVDQVDLELWS